MFRKIVSNLPFSPALVGQVSFYAHRLKKEGATRKVGLVFVAMALVVQSLALFQPPEPANAANNNDMVVGGLGTGSKKSLSKFLRPYDNNTRNIKDVMDYNGITRSEISSAKFTSWKAGNKLSWGFEPRFSSSQGEKRHDIKDDNGKHIVTVYSRPNKLFNGSNTTIYGWVGKSKEAGWFAVMQSCGNLMTNDLPPPPPPEPEEPEPPVLSKNAKNISQDSVDASSTTAQAGDRISYTLKIKNPNDTPITVDIEEHLADVLEYSTLADLGGGTFNEEDKILFWPSVTLGANSEQTRTFFVRVLPKIPSTPQGISDPSSYDCRMTNTFGNSIDVWIECPTPKIIEEVVTELPQTGPTENAIFGSIVLALATYFYMRNRQMRKEIKEVRHYMNSGVI